MMAETTTDYVCPIKFEYRFDRNAAKHSQALTIRRALANAYAEKHQAKNRAAFKIESFELYPVPRAGHSGSEVFYLDIYHQGHQQPNRFVAKFQDVKSTKKSTLARCLRKEHICALKLNMRLMKLMM